MITNARTITAYGTAPGKIAGAICRAIRDGLLQTARGERVRIHRWSDPIGNIAFREWFRNKIDGLINIKAGLRADGAKLRDRGVCKCRACVHRRNAHGDREYEYCTTCPSPHWAYGRRWEYPFQAGMVRDARRIHDRLLHRVIVRQFETDIAHRRFKHLLTTKEDE